MLGIVCRVIIPYYVNVSFRCRDACQSCSNLFLKRIVLISNL
jgi:hypothetical protein